MPFVRIEITRGADRAQKEALVADVTSALVRILDKRPEHIHIVIDEHAEEDWGYSGMLTDDFRRLHASGAPAGGERR